MSRQDLSKLADIPKTIDIRQSDVRPEAYWASFQTKRAKSICMLSIYQLLHPFLQMDTFNVDPTFHG